VLDTKNAKRWVKIVSWTLAIVFGISFSFLMYMPGREAANSSSSENAPETTQTTSAETQTPAPPAVQLARLVGQAGVAADNHDFDQAIDLYEQAAKLDENNQDVKNGLADAYYERGKANKTKDSTVAIESFNKYLELLPDGPQADEVSGIIADLTSTPEQ
jgi:tetratricopeptide (TPR) repeat protein